MGFSSLGVVMGIISQVHFIDFRINALYQQKFAISRRASATSQLLAGNVPMPSTGGLSAADQQAALAQWQAQSNANSAAQQAEQAYEKTLEVPIDQELEMLKAQRTALESQKQEFQKYVSDGLKSTFKNNYA